MIEYWKKIEPPTNFPMTHPKKVFGAETMQSMKKSKKFVNWVILPKKKWLPNWTVDQRLCENWQGKTRLNIPMLERIAAILGINLTELLNINDKNLVCLISENSQNSSNYYANETTIELEKLQLILNHKDELLLQKDREIEALKLALSAFRNSSSLWFNMSCNFLTLWLFRWHSNYCYSDCFH